MCATCERPLPDRGTRYMLTISTDAGGDEIAFCTADCRRRWTGRSSRPIHRKAA